MIRIWGEFGAGRKSFIAGLFKMKRKAVQEKENNEKIAEKYLAYEASSEISTQIVALHGPDKWGMQEGG